VGRLLGVLTLTPYGHWRHAHAIHHASSGHLGKRGVGDIDTLTVAEYQARTYWTRLRYRVYRHPLIMFCIGPAFVFLLQNRLPAGFMRDGWRPWVSTMGTNIGIVAIGVVLGRVMGLAPLLLIGVPVMVLGAAVGVWLFYVQHQFPATYWETDPRWNARDASLYGSSHYDLPPPLRWLTANIGVHHVHHLCSRIPFYRLRDVIVDHPELQAVGRLTLWQSFGCSRLTLWDENARRLVSFAEVRRRQTAVAQQI
jgi:acyl-lipid omega-6 desaturase (Delta-12 desaturase)